MKVAAVVFCFVAVATAAPVEKAAPKVVPVAPALLREKRSSYGAVYSPPCASAPLSVAPAYGLPSLPHVPSYGYNAHAGYPAVGYGGPHYRADDAMVMTEDGEMMSFSDHAMARSLGYDAPALQYGGQAYGSSVAGSAVGVFPNAHVSGCNVPLLLSCSPSIVAGKIVSQPGYGGSNYAVVPAAAPAGYRGVDEHHISNESPAEDHNDDHAMLSAHHEQRMKVPEAGHAPPMHSQ